MARAKKRIAKVEESRPSVEGVANNLVEKLYGPHGPAWGIPLTEIEDALLEIRQILTEKMFDLSLAQQAASQERSAPYCTCPACQQPPACDDRHARVLHPRAGEAHWPEPEGYCNPCRRAFFPLVQEPGN
jgi:hypothetical protein